MASTKNKAVVAIGVIDIARHAAKAWSASAERKERESRTLGFSSAVESARESAEGARGSLVDTLRSWSDSLSDSRAVNAAQSAPDRARSARDAALKAERQYAKAARKRLHESAVLDRIGGRDMPWRPNRTERALEHVPLVGSVVAAVVMVVAAVAYAVRHNHAHDHDLASSTDASEVDPRGSRSHLRAADDSGDDASVTVDTVPLRAKASEKLGAAKDVAADGVARVKDNTTVLAHRVANAGGAAVDAGATKLAAGGSKAAASTSALAGAGKQAVKDHVVDEAKHQLDERVIAPVKKKAITIGVLGFVGLTVWVAVIAVLVQLGIQALS